VIIKILHPYKKAPTPLMHSRCFYEATGKNVYILFIRNNNGDTKYFIFFQVLRDNALMHEDGMMSFFWQNETKETVSAQLKTKNSFLCRVLNPSSPVTGYLIGLARLAKVLWTNIHLLWDPGVSDTSHSLYYNHSLPHILTSFCVLWTLIMKRKLHGKILLGLSYKRTKVRT
jgi:hypothetical protein